MTNSPRKVSLTAEQFDELKTSYVERLVDNMDVQTLVQYVSDDLYDWVDKLTSSELKEEINSYDDELYDELVDNVTSPDVTLNVIK
tara:strand:+ start:155 stop:412 length:258 start_codon:yes stop_codon:yes gene_type:complete